MSPHLHLSGCPAANLVCTILKINYIFIYKIYAKSQGFFISCCVDPVIFVILFLKKDFLIYSNHQIHQMVPFNLPCDLRCIKCCRLFYQPVFGNGNLTLTIRFIGYLHLVLCQEPAVISNDYSNKSESKNGRLLM